MEVNFDTEVQIGYSTPEPSLRNLVMAYYVRSFDFQRARQLTEVYLSELVLQSAPEGLTSPTQ